MKKNRNCTTKKESIQPSNNATSTTAQLQVPPQPCQTFSTNEDKTQNRVNEICQKIIEFGHNNLSFKDLQYLHQILYKTALRLQKYNVNFPSNEGSKTNRTRRMEGRLIIMEAELKKCKEMIEKFRNEKDLLKTCKTTRTVKLFPRNCQRSW